MGKSGERGPEGEPGTKVLRLSFFNSVSNNQYLA